MQTRWLAPRWHRRAGVVHALLAIALLVGAFAPLTILTAQTARAQDQQIIVGLITKTETNPFFVKMKEGAEKAAQENNVKLLTASGKFDADNASQVTAIENMVTAGAKGILITPGDTKAIVPAIEKARQAGVLVIALDTPTEPMDATDALFATDNFKAGELDGEYAKVAMAGKTPIIATIDGSTGVSVSVLRHNGFLAGFGPAEQGGATPVASMSQFAPDSRVVCSQDADGDQAKSQTAMENCLQKSGDINLVYAINEPAARGAYNALKAAGKENDVLIVAVDGGCSGIQMIKDGQLAATAQQYPLKMAQMGVEAVVKFAKTGEKPSGYTDTGVNLITDKPMEGVPSKDTTFGAANCWG
ncbi:MAG TPA: sugar ABC transporter substrate-binding protein [Thermomicrobiales bacterium]|nr:sugar ABC transporter substrate-binding protein [Thermomicrobiales bacterium]